MGLLKSESQRVRVRHPKTRTGCVTCRFRRIKCDEEKPECGRCRKTGRQCAGYKIPVPWLFQSARKEEPEEDGLALHEASTGSDDSNPSRKYPGTDRALVHQSLNHKAPALLHRCRASGAPLLRPVSIVVGDTPYERRAFQLYVNVGPALCEVAEESDYELLTVLVPQACHDLKLLRSAMFCLTSYFLSLADPAQRERHWMLAEYQYMRVIKSMASSRLSSPNWTATVMLCLLLIVIESHRNDHKRALTHLQAAVSIYQENQSTTEARLLDVTLRRVSERLHHRVLIAKDNFPDNNPVWHQTDKMFFYRRLYQTMKTICMKLQNFRVLPPQERQFIQQNCLDILQQTSVHVFQTLRNQQHDRELFRPQEAYLRIQHQTCRVVLSNVHRSRFHMFHGCDEVFNAILADCDLFSDSYYRGDAIVTSSQPTPIRFTFSTEFIMNLFFVATECHSLTVRRKAIHALRRCCRREKFWDSFHAATVAEWLLKEEEKQRDGLQQDTDDEPASRLLLSSLQLFQEDDGLSAFRRPGWVRVEVEDLHGVKDYWLHLGEAVFGSLPPQTTYLHKPQNKKLCYQVSKPIWPAAAKMIGQTCVVGRIEGLVDLGG